MIILVKFKETEIGKIPEDWNVSRLADIADILTGFPFKGSEYSFDEGTIVVRGENLKDRRFRWDTIKKWKNIDGEIKNYLLKKGVCVISMDGNVGKNKAVVRETDPPLLLAQRVAAITAKQGISQDFINQVILSDQFLSYCERVKTGTTIAHISRGQLENFLLPIPPIREQSSISKILSDIDSKIELNNQINTTLNTIAQSLFKLWFLDFEFPNEEGTPYKSSGGKMVESEIDKVPDGWKVDGLKILVENLDSKRVPLSSRERAKRKGPYPYYGATCILDHVDSFLFDGIYLLLGEDGTVIDDNGNPILQYVWNKFWVNNHAHILVGKRPYSTEFIYLLLKNKNINHILTGAVQLKINQSNLNNLRVIVPPYNIVERFNKYLDSIFLQYRNLFEETKNLEKIKDSLIPKLMQGEIRIPIGVSK